LVEGAAVWREVASLRRFSCRVRLTVDEGDKPVEVVIFVP